MKRTGMLAVVLAGSMIGLVACDDTARGAREDAAEAQQEAAEEARDASDAAREAGDEAEDAVDEAGQAVEQAGARADAALETIDVKAALMADRTVDASNIDVDTDHVTKTVVLKGTVATAAQREEAGRIAAAEADGYKIDNRLTVTTR